jgi:hypothetical protein
MTKIAIATIRGEAAYSQSKYHSIPKLNKELPQDYERRTWRKRIHQNEDGNVIIPPMCWKNCLSEAAKFLSIQIPGKGKSTYTKHFESGVLVVEPSVLPIKASDVRGDWVFVPADGIRGSGKRVEKCYPIIDPGWQCQAEFFIFDDVITKDVFLMHLKQAGQLIGIGRFRPRNNGYYGRFKVLDLEWKDAEYDELVSA